MASDQPSSDSTRPGKPFVPGPAAGAVVSLSQAILAPLDALAKAQVHAARSFLNFVMQIGYPHRTEGASPNDGEALYCQDFQVEQVSLNSQGQAERKQLNLRVPTLALVPLQPLNIESAQFSVELVISDIEPHQQMQSSEVEALKTEPQTFDRPPTSQPRPWYLVSEPLSIRGTLTHPGDGKAQERNASIKIDVTVKSGPTPAGLAKLLTSLTQASELSHLPGADTPPAIRPVDPNSQAGDPATIV